VIDALTKGLQAALKDGTVKQRFNDLGTDPIAEKRATPEALRTQLKSEIERWSPIIKKAGVYAD
jgi:tripartite-type tricarboxylate transporter receptor subunit TctC